MLSVILIVDDSPIMADALRTALNGRGYRVAVADDGESALALLDPLEPELLLLDLCMPRLDGIAFLERLRARGGVRPKVIAYSGSAALESIARQGGADAFLSKPLVLEALVGTIESLLRRSAHRLDAPEVRAQLQLTVEWLRDFFGVQRAFATRLEPGALRLLASSVPEAVELPVSVDPAAHFCPEVVRAATPLVLHDSSAHPTFASHLAAIGGVRFYAGTPLFDPHDLAIGSLCLEDDQPHPFSPEDLRLLGQLAQVTGRFVAGAGPGALVAPFTLHESLLGLLLELELDRQRRSEGGLALALLCGAPTARAAPSARRQMAVIGLESGVAVILGEASRERAERRMLHALGALHGGEPPARAAVITLASADAAGFDPLGLLGVAAEILADVASGVVAVRVCGRRTVH
jgi:DNA-binding response OmpR family regulator